MKTTRSEKKKFWLLLSLFFLFAAGILAIGFFVLAMQLENFKTEAHNNLAAVADSKVEQIIQWRKERLSDALVILDNRSFVRQVEKSLQGNDQEMLTRDVLSVLESYQKHYKYHSISIIDKDGRIRLSSPSHAKEIGTNAKELIQKVLTARKPLFSDLHVLDTTSFVHIDLAGPIFGSNKNDSTIIGILFFRIDPKYILFPLLQTWPTPSRSAETLLFKQQGDSIVYLNELRHQKNTTLTLHQPISNDALPASKSLRGFKGVVEGIDYRGIPVLAAIRNVPDSPWYLNTEIDRSEIYAPLNSYTWTTIIGVFLFIAALGGIFGLWWRHQAAVFYRNRYINEIERQTLLTHLDYAVKFANDIILLVNQEHRIVDANEVACKTYGYTQEEITQLTLFDLHSPSARTHVEEQMKQVERAGGLVFETEHLRKDGTLIPVEISSRYINMNGSIFSQSIIRNITERKRNEQALQTAKQFAENLIQTANTIVVGLDTNGTITTFNQAAERITGYSREELENKNWFETIVPKDRYPHVWAEFNRLLQGELPKSFENPILTKDGNERYIVWSNSILKERNVIVGSVSFGLDITERRHMEEALRVSESMLNESQHVASVGYYILDVKTGTWTCSQTLNTIFGINESYSKNIEGWKQLIHPAYREEMYLYLKNYVFQEKNRFDKEYKIIRQNDHAERWLHGLGNLECDDRGNVLKMFGTIQDVTARRQFEDEREEERNLLQSLIDTIPDDIFVKDAEGRIILDNIAHQKHLGAEGQQETLGKTDFDFLPKETAESYSADEQEIIRSGKLFLSYEEKSVTPDGHQKWLLTTKVPLKDKEGKTIGIVGINHDISNRKRTENALREINETLNTIFEAAPLPIFALDLDGQVQKIWNPAAEKLLGWKKEEVLGKTLPSVAPEKAREFEKFRLQIQNGLSLNGIQVVHKKKDGTPIEYAIYATPLRDHEKNITGNIVLLVDLSERRQAEDAIRQTEGLFKILVESSPVAIAVFTGSQKIIKYISNRFTELFGYQQEDIPTMDAWWPLAYPVEEYRGQIQTKWCESIEQGIQKEAEIEPLESVVTCQDGSTKYIETSFISVGEDTLVFYIDLTQHRLAQEALRQTHSFNELLIQTMPFGIDIVDETGKILFMSKVMRDMLGSSAGAFCCWETFKDDKKQCDHCPLQNGIRFGKPETIETAGVFGGKTYQISHVGMMYEGKKAVLEVFQDITEQKKLQQELIQSQKLLSIGTMAGGIAHDFNNILAIILGYSSILHSIKDNKEKFSNGVTAIRQAVDRGAGLVRQILTFARKTDISFEPLSIAELIKEIVSMLQQTFPKIITFNTNIEKHLPFILADHTQMHQALLNLCVNARDAMPQGGEISVGAAKISGEKMKERFPATKGSSYIALSVSDTGIGMSESVRSQIFDPFFTTKEKGKGTGLGLSVVYGIVQAHHGFLNVESSPDHGTTFFLYFPIPEEISEAKEYQKDTADQIAGGNETLLFVEDEILLLEMVQILLESNGYTVLTAKDGDEAVQIYQEQSNRIHLVISDMGLPKLTGMSEFEKMKEINPAVKVIFASGYFEPDTKAMLEKAGVKGFLQKPYVIEDILSKIRKTLDSPS